MKPREIFFYSDGLKLAGLLYEPEGSLPGQRWPAVVCCHGYTGMKDVYLLPVPERLAAHGYVALAFDHRGFGKSEGTRARLIPWEQAEDIRNALTFAASLPNVDTARLGLYGTSFGGANVVMVAGTDERARCTVCVVGIGDGERWLKSLRSHWEWLKFLDRLAEDRVGRVLTGESKRVDVTELMPGDPHSRKVIEEKVKTAQTYTKGYPLENADATIRYRPESVVHRVAPRPILFIHSERDGLVPADESRSMYAKAGEPKKLVILPGADHYDVYQFVNPEVFETVMRETIAWIDTHLKAGAPGIQSS